MNHVVHCVHCLIMACALALAAGCAPQARVDSLRQQGKTQLAPQQALELVQGHSMNITTFGEEITLYYDASGRLFARDYDQNQDAGRWDVSEGGELCLKLGKWWFGDMRCFTVWPEGNRFLLMRADGGLAYHATPLAANPAGLTALATQQAGAAKQRASFRQSTEEAGDVAAATAAPPPPAPSSTVAKRSSYRSAVASGETGDSDAATAATVPLPAVPEPATLAAPAMSSGEMKSTVRWLARDCPGCNMENADLRGADLVAADLQGANLRGANLREANLRRAKLQGANLESAVLEQTNLPGADLRNTTLRNANLRGANLIRADLTGADLRGADLSGALLEGATGIK